MFIYRNVMCPLDEGSRFEGSVSNLNNVFIFNPVFNVCFKHTNQCVDEGLTQTAVVGYFVLILQW